MLPNLHKQVSGGKLRYLRTQVSDRPWAKEPAPLGFWGGEGSPGGGWGGGVGFAFVARAGKGRCPSRAPGVPPAPPLPLPRPPCSSCAPVSLLRPAAPPAPQCPSCAPGVPASPAPLLRPDFTAARTPPEDPDCGTRPAGRARGRPRAASEGSPDALLPGEVAAQGSAPRVRAPLGNRGGRGCTGHGRGGQGRRAAGPGGSGSGDSAPRVSRNAARAELTGVGAAKWRSIQYWPQTPL